MVPRKHRRFGRPGEFPRAVLLLIWAGFAGGLLFSALGWLPMAALKLKLRPQPAAAALVPIPNSTEAYTGSIYFVPSRGDSCWERMLDNRTGDMWDKGYVDCAQAAPPRQPVSVPRNPMAGMGGERLLAIGKALRHEGD